MKFECKKCGCRNYFIKESGQHVGLYCENNHWQKWLKESEIYDYKTLLSYKNEPLVCIKSGKGFTKKRFYYVYGVENGLNVINDYGENVVLWNYEDDIIRPSFYAEENNTAEFIE